MLKATEMSSNQTTKFNIPQKLIDLAIDGQILGKNHLRILWYLAKHQNGAVNLPLAQTRNRAAIAAALNIKSDSDMGKYLRHLYSLDLVVEPKKLEKQSLRERIKVESRK
ncbi:MAG: hypothetical protein ACRC8K_07505 [Waterburya sp.]